MSVDDRRLISLSSNDYLGLTHHPRLREAALAAVREFGVGSGAVRTIAGTMSMHEELEAELAEFKGTPAVLTFQSGFTANTGVIPTITGETGPDRVGRAQPRLDHRRDAPVQGASQGLPARRHRGPARDPARGRASRPARHGRPTGSILVVTDGVFSMDGDIAPLPGIVEAAEAFGAAVMVDDAHASGVLGRNGRGTRRPLRAPRPGRDPGRHAVARPSASLGGYVAGSQALREILTQRARPFLFSTSHPPAVVAACREAIQVHARTSPS